MDVYRGGSITLWKYVAPGGTGAFHKIRCIRGEIKNVQTFEQYLKQKPGGSILKYRSKLTMTSSRGPI